MLARIALQAFVLASLSCPQCLSFTAQALYGNVDLAKGLDVDSDNIYDVVDVLHAGSWRLKI